MSRIVLATTLIPLSIAVAGCGGAAAPNARLADAKSALSAAKAADAANVPEGALQIKLSDDAIRTAEAEIQSGDDDRAAMTLERAKADADLALLLARENRAREELRQFQTRAAEDR